MISPASSSLVRGILASFSLVGLASANPTGEDVLYGGVTFERFGNELWVNQQTDRAIIDWRSFSIAQGETTTFLQPRSNSAVLNRVTGDSVSRIDGWLQSNGRVLLINPSGIIIGPTGRIDVGGLVASTLDVSDADFLGGGNMTFRGASQAAVINLGSISALQGDVYLFARTVNNAGTISAANGRIGLAAGSDILLQESGDERVFVRSSSENGSVRNSGDIRKTTAELKAHGGNIYGMAVKNEGRVSATSVTRSGGQIFLSAGGGGNVQSTGSLTASRNGGAEGGTVSLKAEAGAAEVGGTVDAAGSDVGGSVIILGDTVELFPDTLILADGDFQGGSVRIRGGRQGLESEYFNAASTVIGDGSRVDVSARLDGDGGEAIFFAEKDLEYFGFTAARGGIDGGNGGFVELSGKENVLFNGFVSAADLSAPQGQAGKLLFDPINVSVLHSAIPVTGLSTPVRMNTVYDFDINTFLNSSGSLEIRTDGVGSDEGNPSIASDVGISWITGNELKFTVDNDFNMATGASINANGAGSVDVLAGGGIYIGGATISTMNGGISLIAQGGSASFMEHGLELSGSSISTTTGAISMSGAAPLGSVGDGVRSDSAAQVTTSGGSISISGQGDGSGLAIDMFVSGGTLNSTDVSLETRGGNVDVNGTLVRTLSLKDSSGTASNHFLLDWSSIDNLQSIGQVGSVDLQFFNDRINIGPLDSTSTVSINSGSMPVGFIAADSPSSISPPGGGVFFNVTGPVTAQELILNGSYDGDVFNIIGASGAAKVSVYGQEGNDSILFRNAANLNSIDGGMGINTLLIDDSGLTGNQSYQIGEGVITRNPTFQFFQIQGVNILFGSGDDTVFTTNTSFLQALNGGPGIDSLYVDGNLVLDSPIGNISHVSFEGPVRDSTDQGDILNTVINPSPLDPLGQPLPAVDNLFNQTPEIPVVDIFALNQNQVTPLGGGFSAGIINNAVVFVFGPNTFPGNQPLGLDGVSQPPIGLVFRLSDALGIGGFVELALALEFEGTGILDSNDGGFALDLSGPAPQDVAEAMKNSLLVAAALEILQALEVSEGAPLTNVDGVAAVGLFPGPPDPAVVAALSELIGDEAAGELAGALGF